jgi:acyl carrier protein
MGMHTFQEFYFVQDNQKIEISYDHLIVDIAADSFATVILTAPLENFFTVICTDLTVDSTVLV